MAENNVSVENGNDVDKSQWIVALNESVLSSTEDDPVFCKLRHPKSNEGAMFLFAAKNSLLFEVLKFSEPFRSWFIAQNVQQDGGFMMTTAVDPVFLALPYFLKTQQVDKYQVLDQLLNDDEFHEVHRLAACVDSKQLQHVADVKGDDDYKAYRYNKEKTLTWLKKKVERIADRLKEEKIRVSGSATTLYVSSNEEYSRDDYISYAHGMVSDYLPMELSEELKTSMGIAEPVREKRSHSNTEEPQAKRARTGELQPSEDYSTKDDKKDAKSKSAAKSKLDKVDKSGMKSIASFFAPKAKK